MDLHLHTPASIDFKQQNVTYLDFLKKAEEKNLDVIALTDHNSVVGYARYLEEVESLELLERLGRLRDDERERLAEYRRLREKILILPGFEFTATLGFHILGIFPQDTTIRELEHLLLLLRVPPEKLDQGSGEVGATTDALTAYRMINEAGGLVIAAHANSSHGVAMPGFDFGGQTRIAYTQDPNLHALEVTDLDSRLRRRTAAFFSGTKPEYPRRMHCIQGSDAHKLDFDPRYKNEMGVGIRATEILVDELSFDAIKEVFVGNDFSRTRPYRPSTEEPFDPVRAAREQGDSLVQAFHERLHEKRGVARSILEDVVALANTNGGTIYIGASANPKTAVVGVDRPEQASAELRATISKEITPPLEVQVDVVKSQNKSILQLIVPRGSEAPYALEGTYIYVRSENETGLAMRDEVVQLVRDALAVELAAGAVASPPAEAQHPEKDLEEGTEVAARPAVAVSTPQVDPPRTGVEIVSSQVRKGTVYYSVRDLRNSRIVQNVTRASARRLWQYAIEEQEKHTCDPTRVSWIGNIGVCKSHKRGGKMRYDLVQRQDGKLFIYYGVTEDGIHGEWRKLIEGENGEAEETEAETTSDQQIETSEPQIETAEPSVSESFSLSEDQQHGQEVISGEQTEEAPSGEEPWQGRLFGEQYSAKPPETDRALPAGQPVEALPPSFDQPERLTDADKRDAPTPEETIPAHEETSAEFVEPTQQSQVKSGIDERQPVPESRQPEPPPASSKTRAQAWREILDRAIAEAKAAQNASQSNEQPPTPEIRGEEAALAEDRAATQGEAKAKEIDQSEEQSGDAERLPRDRIAPGDDEGQANRI